MQKRGRVSGRKCYLCDANQFIRVKGKVRDLPRLPILQCKNCGLVFLSDFGHVDDAFYAESRMREGEPIREWKCYLRECYADDLRRAESIKAILPAKSILDFGCGAGGFLSLIKSSAKRCAGVEKDTDLRNTIEKHLGVKIYPDIADIDEKFDLITLFHVLEHFKDPRDLLGRLSKVLTQHGVIIIEVPNARDALLSLYDCKAFSEFTYWGCHLYLFDGSNLRALIRSAGLLVDSVEQIQRYPLSNHLYWLSQGKPGGHTIWNFLDSEELTRAYTSQLAALGICDTLVATARIR
jgi:cyclopropane fatty-acyl-phospholipid synthase-like methyltransferase